MGFSWKLQVAACCLPGYMGFDQKLTTTKMVLGTSDSAVSKTKKILQVVKLCLKWCIKVGRGWWTCLGTGGPPTLKIL